MKRLLGRILPDMASLFGVGPVLYGERIFLRPARRSDFAQWQAVRERSKTFLEPWEPRWAQDELTRRLWRARLRQYRSERKHGTGETFLIFVKDHGELAGGISVFNIRRGASQSGQIGYWMSVDHAGKGMMAEALRLVCDHCFDTVMLHRIEAACIPRNHRSVFLLEKAGFRQEGLLRSYLRINGKWEDHFLFALLSEDRGLKARKTGENC